MRVFRGYVSGEVTIRSMMGREFLVLPVVAFQVGVWQGMNSDAPEYTPITTLKHLPDAWNGRPVVADHPTDEDGEPTTAGTPNVFSSAHMGWVFNARIEDDALVVDAWIDMETPSSMSQNVSSLLDKIEAGEPIEVSIGAFVRLEKRKGMHKGQEYGAVWKEIWPDHLAFLSEGIGACSNEDGCGVRFNSGDAFATAQASAETMERLNAMRSRSQPVIESRSVGAPPMRTFLANGLFDRDVRRLLQTHLEEAFTLPYVIAFSDQRVVFDAIVLDENGDMSDIVIYVADYEIDESNMVRLTSSAEPAWLAIAPVPFNTPVPVTESEGEAEMSTNKDVEEAQELTEVKAESGCGCEKPPVINSLGDIKNFLGSEHVVSRELSELEALRERRRQELIEYIGEDAGEDADLASCSVAYLEMTAQIVKRARERSQEKKPVYRGDEGGVSAYYGAPGAAGAPARAVPPAPPKVFETSE